MKIYEKYLTNTNVYYIIRITRTQKCTKIKEERRNEYGEYDENVYYRR